jgi:hypothetical protein
MKVFLRTTRGDRTEWIDTEEDLEQLPAVGEFVLRTTRGHWYEVLVVIHVPKRLGSHFDAEVVAVEVDETTVLESRGLPTVCADESVGIASLTLGAECHGDAPAPQPPRARVRANRPGGSCPPRACILRRPTSSIAE